ncbi:MAG: hypothetical protein M1831_003857 [Alyxoria varia]|nr:MAG: hypothetical protein M1831_003857 [Alyxoria varia]
MGRQAWLNRFVLGRSSSGIPDWQYYLDTGNYIQLSDEEITAPDPTFKWVDPNPPHKLYKCIDPDNLECYGHTYDEKGHPYSKASRALRHAQDAAEKSVTMIALKEAKRAAAETQKNESADGESEAEDRVATSEKSGIGQEQWRGYVFWVVRMCIKNAVMLTPMVSQTATFKSSGNMAVMQHFTWNVHTYRWTAPFAPGLLELMAISSMRFKAPFQPLEVVIDNLLGPRWVSTIVESTRWAIRFFVLPIRYLRALRLLPQTWPLQPGIRRTLRTAILANPRTFIAISTWEFFNAQYARPFVTRYIQRPLTHLMRPTSYSRHVTERDKKKGKVGSRLRTRFAHAAASSVASLSLVAVTWPLRTWALRRTASAYIRASSTTMTNSSGSTRTRHLLEDVYAPSFYGLWPRGDASGGSANGAGVPWRYFGKIGPLMLLRAAGEVTWSLLDDVLGVVVPGWESLSA